MQAEKKLIKARAGLVLSSPFFASIALYLKLKQDTTSKTAYTDTVVLGYNPAYIDTLSIEEVQAVICHEVLHIVLQHPFRMESRDHKKWNSACDYAVNLMITEYALPKGALLDECYNNMEAEQIYQKLPDTLPKGSILMGDIRPSKQEKKWKVRIAQAARIAQGKLPSNLERKIKQILSPKLPWQEILSRFITEHTSDDYSWLYPNKRYLYSGLYLPAIQSPALKTIAIIIDTSGSIKQEELDYYASELQAILVLYPKTKLQVIYVDTKVAYTETITSDNLTLHPHGGGGTNYKPGFEYIEKEQIQPSCILCFTDGYCRLFPDKPDYPTLWLLTTGKKFKPPFGEVIQIGIK